MNWLLLFKLVTGIGINNISSYKQLYLQSSSGVVVAVVAAIIGKQQTISFDSQPDG